MYKLCNLVSQFWFGSLNVPNNIVILSLHLIATSSNVSHNEAMQFKNMGY